MTLVTFFFFVSSFSVDANIWSILSFCRDQNVNNCRNEEKKMKSWESHINFYSDPNRLIIIAQILKEHCVFHLGSNNRVIMWNNLMHLSLLTWICSFVPYLWNNHFKLVPKPTILDSSTNSSYDLVKFYVGFSRK